MIKGLKAILNRFSLLSLRKIRILDQVPLTLILVGIFLGLLTLGVLAGFSIFDMSHRYLLVLLGLDVVILLLLGVVIAKKIVKIWVDRQRGLAGSKIHVRITALFAIVSIIPAISMTVFSILFFHYGVQDWFSGRIKGALAESVAVATSYLKEHENIVAKDATLMAYDLNQEFSMLVQDRRTFDHYLTVMASLRSLTEAIVFDQEQALLGRSYLTFALQFEPLPSWALQKARGGKVALLSSNTHDRMRALIELPGRPGIFLFVGRSVDPKVLEHLKKSEEIFKEYGALEGQRTGFELIIMVLFSVVALLLLLVSIWVGISISGKLIEPIRNLIDAAEKMRLGNLSIRVPEKQTNQEDEMNLLSRSFNRMVQTIQKQQFELIKANKELETRKQFIESTLAGVSVGVIGLDAKGNILYPNQMASELLNIDLSAKIGQKLTAVFPPLKQILDAPMKSKNTFFEQQAMFQIRGVQHTFLIRVLLEMEAQGVVGYVVTLDEITSLLDAQKQAAWSDVARRVAHEIKNPLTPIHLAAERMRRKYLKEIKTSPETFLECIDTITRQVAYIGNMVSEFSSFARMPAPVMKKENLNDIINQIISLQKNSAGSSIIFDIKISQEPTYVLGDEQQISQALLNVVKNAMESILESDRPENKKGKITIGVEKSREKITIFVEDNGPGFPKDLQDNLLDPYVTTRPKGTGLGLSIVKRIMEDHQGKLTLGNKERGVGARVSLVFPMVENI